MPVRAGNLHNGKLYTWDIESIRTDNHFEIDRDPRLRNLHGPERRNREPLDPMEDISDPRPRFPPHHCTEEREKLHSPLSRSKHMGILLVLGTGYQSARHNEICPGFQMRPEIQEKLGSNRSLGKKCDNSIAFRYLRRMMVGVVETGLWLYEDRNALGFQIFDSSIAAVAINRIDLVKVTDRELGDINPASRKLIANKQGERDFQRISFAMAPAASIPFWTATSLFMWSHSPQRPAPKTLKRLAQEVILPMASGFPMVFTG